MPRNRSQPHPVEVSNVYLAPNVYKARKLDEKLFETEPNANARPIPKRLNSYLRVRRHCVGAFAECSADIHVLLWETAKSAAKHNWRKVGATSPETAFATYMAITAQPMGCRNRPAGSAPPAPYGVSDLLSTTSTPNRQGLRDEHIHRFRRSTRRTAHGMRLRPLPFLGDHLRGRIRIGTCYFVLVRRWPVEPLTPSCIPSCSIPFPGVFFLSMPLTLTPLCSAS